MGISSSVTNGTGVGIRGKGVEKLSFSQTRGWLLGSPLTKGVGVWIKSSKRLVGAWGSQIATGVSSSIIKVVVGWREKLSKRAEVSTNNRLRG